MPDAVFLRPRWSQGSASVQRKRCGARRKIARMGDRGAAPTTLEPDCVLPLNGSSITNHKVYGYVMTRMNSRQKRLLPRGKLA